MKRPLLLLFAAALASCSLNVDSPQGSPTDPSTERVDPALGVDIATMTKTPSGAYYKDILVGSGAILTGQPSITFTFAGFIKSGATFGNGVQASPYPVSSFVAGLAEGIQGIRIGGQRLIVVPSALGYGGGVYGAVPPNSTLIYLFQLDAIFQ